MIRSKINEKEGTAHKLVYVTIMLLVGILIGIAGFCFISYANLTISAEELSEVEAEKHPEFYQASTSINRTDSVSDTSEDIDFHEQKVEMGQDQIFDMHISEVEKEKVEKYKTIISTSNREESKDEKPIDIDNYEDNQTTWKMLTSKTCNIRSGPDMSYDSLRVVDSSSMVIVSDRVNNGNTPWYRVTLDDGTEGYISGRCLSDLNSEIETTSASLSISMCPAKEGLNDENISTIKPPFATDLVTETQSATTDQSLIIEVPNEKYDYRPGDYHGELSQFMGRSISEVQSAFPSFTHNPYGDSNGNLYDNFWTTVEFRYKDNSVNQIVISQCDPSYSLMGVSVGMDAETARSVLAGQGYPFDEPFQDGLGYWMHSADDHYEVEVDIYEGKVMTMMLLDLTKVDPWWKNNGILY